LATDEAQLLLQILPKYYQHFLDNKTTLLPRFYGCHGVRVPHGEIVTVVIMGNVFCSPVTIHEQYDLKGSTVNRYAGMDKDPTLKSGMDVDLKRRLKLAPYRKEQFLIQISKDALFLASLNIMDFSLLLGFHFLSPPEPSPSGASFDLKNSTDIQDSSQALRFVNIDSPDSLLMHLSTCETEIYFTGIIDILQLYNTKKKAERFLKVYILGKNKAGLSSMPPEAYARRFIQGMHKIVE